VAGAVLALSAPAAHAASLGSKVGQLSGKVAGLAKAVDGLKDTDTGQNASIDRVNARVDTVVGNLASALSALAAVQTTVNDPATGVAALNSARLIAVNFTTQNTDLAPHTGATINFATSTVKSVRYVGRYTTNGLTRFAYLIDFGADVSKRFPSFSANNANTGIDTTDIAIVNCGAPGQSVDHCAAAAPGTGGPNMALVTSTDDPNVDPNSTYSILENAG
jgi:hypothetical protein